MKKYIFLMLLLSAVFSITVFGQSYEGNYRAKFISLDKNINPVAEFQITSGRTVNGKILIGETVTIIQGTVNEIGNLEAKSTGKIIYTLKADLSRNDGKITFNSRSAENAFGRQSFSQMAMQGNFSRIEKAAVSSEKSASKESVLSIEQPSPLFAAKEFSSAQAKVIVEKDGFLRIYHLQMSDETQTTERGFYFSLARPESSTQNIWRIENIRALNYVEKIEKFTRISRFRSNYDLWRQNKDIVGGQIEIISENNNLIVFKITNLKIKNESSLNVATINGIIYAAISK